MVWLTDQATHRTSCCASYCAGNCLVAIFEPFFTAPCFYNNTPGDLRGQSAGQYMGLVSKLTPEACSQCKPLKSRECSPDYGICLLEDWASDTCQNTCSPCLMSIWGVRGRMKQLTGVTTEFQWRYHEVNNLGRKQTTRWLPLAYRHHLRLLISIVGHDGCVWGWIWRRPVRRRREWMSVTSNDWYNYNIRRENNNVTWLAAPVVCQTW